MLVEAVKEQLDHVLDPELDISIIQLGLVYDIRCTVAGDVHVVMTLTSPTCPLHQQFVENIQAAAKRVPGVKNVTVEFTFTPSWSIAKASELARDELLLRGIPLAW